LSNTQHILITGATSGIGLGILKAYHKMGWAVTAVNRREDQDIEGQFQGVRFCHFDVQNLQAIKQYFDEASRSNQLPSVYFLTAGINHVDNLERFSIETFREVMETNLMGVLNFVSVALSYMPSAGQATFVAASSTTNLVPNPNCMGYYVSKRALYDIFKMMDRLHRNRGIRFKTLVLGPVATNIFGSAKLASKVQEAVRDLITVSVDQAVDPIVRFVQSRRQVFYYPKHSCLLYSAVRMATSVFPGLYKGSAPSSPGVSE